MGHLHTCVLLSDQSVRCFGDNLNGQLGQGHTFAISVPLGGTLSDLPAVDLGLLAGEQIVSISAGGNTNCAVLDLAGVHRVKCWGFNGSAGLLGIGSSAFEARGDAPGEMGVALPAVSFPSGEDPLSVEIGGTTLATLSLCAIVNDGFSNGLSCWGSNSNGQTGSLPANTPAFLTSPAGGTVLRFSDSNQPEKVAIGNGYVCVIVGSLPTLGEVRCWSSTNITGVLGLGSTSALTAPSVASMSSVALESGTTVALEIEAAPQTVCVKYWSNSSALYRVKCWGQGTSGVHGGGSSLALGDNEPLNSVGFLPFSGSVSATSTLASLTAGTSSVCAVLDNVPDIRCWGSAASGVLNNGQSSGAIGDAGGEIASVSPMGIPASFPSFPASVMIRGGSATFCAAATDRLLCWGANVAGEAALGTGQRLGRLFNFTVSDAPPMRLGLDPGEKATDISVTGFHACVLTSFGRAKCWGQNTSGQLGLGDIVARGGVPGTMGSALPFLNFGLDPDSVPLVPTRIRTSPTGNCALFSNGQIKCWGSGTGGRNGVGNTSVVGNTPGSLASQAAVRPTGGAWNDSANLFADLSVGEGFACAVNLLGNLYCWGHTTGGIGILNTLASLGDLPGHVGSFPAIPLGTGLTVSKVVSPRNAACAVMDTGQMKCWGADPTVSRFDFTPAVASPHVGDDPGELGDALPFTTQLVGRTVAGVSMLDNATCAWSRDASDVGAVHCWGSQSGGRLADGVGSSTVNSTPTQVNLGTGFDPVDVISFSGGFCAQNGAPGERQGSWKCWGGALFGEFSGMDSSLADLPTETGDALPWFLPPAVP